MADCVERLRAAGALDVFQVPCFMKKGRAGVALQIIAPAEKVRLLETVVFEHSHSIGIRRYSADRHKLIRQSVTVETSFGPVRGKVVRLPSGGERFSVEDDDARSLAQSNQTTTDAIRQTAEQAFKET
ncbi:MAG: nickel insertion protein [Planctomycetota bacterium]